MSVLITAFPWSFGWAGVDSRSPRSRHGPAGKGSTGRELQQKFGGFVVVCCFVLGKSAGGSTN